MSVRAAAADVTNRFPARVDDLLLRDGDDDDDEACILLLPLLVPATGAVVAACIICVIPVGCRAFPTLLRLR